MARIRTIKPEFWTDSFMVQLPPLARLIYIALWTAADDHGLIPDEPERLAMEVMPKEDGLVFDDWMQLFEASGRIELFAAEDGSTFYQVAKWAKHQRVDKPSKSRIFREGSRKVAIPLEVRRKVAAKYGCVPGEQVDAQCYYCGAFGQVHWHRLSSGRPSAWVTFPGLELDHLEAECGGGEGAEGNIVLACRSCNRSKGSKRWIEHLCTKNSVPFAAILQNPREDSGTERNREQGKEQGTGIWEASSLRSDSSPAKPDDQTSETEPAKLELVNPPPADALPSKAERLAQLTADAIEAFNACPGLTKAKGGNLPNVSSTVGRETRQANVKRVIETARAICREDFDSDRITPEFWAAYFAVAAKDDFHAGRIPGGEGHARWVPDFEFLTRPTTMLKLYDRAASEEAAA